MQVGDGSEQDYVGSGEQIYPGNVGTQGASSLVIDVTCLNHHCDSERGGGAFILEDAIVVDLIVCILVDGLLFLDAQTCARAYQQQHQILLRPRSLIICQSSYHIPILNVQLLRASIEVAPG